MCAEAAMTLVFFAFVIGAALGYFVGYWHGMFDTVFDIFED
jgi:ABC-type dipeptide/oligopeptide/nickel transport system permease subunit